MVNEPYAPTVRRLPDGPHYVYIVSANDGEIELGIIDRCFNPICTNKPGQGSFQLLKYPSPEPHRPGTRDVMIIGCGPCIEYLQRGAFRHMQENVRSGVSQTSGGVNKHPDYGLGSP